MTWSVTAGHGDNTDSDSAVAGVNAGAGRPAVAARLGARTSTHLLVEVSQEGVGVVVRDDIGSSLVALD